jgi:hypothetical protein
MMNSKVGGKKFMIECGVAGFSGENYGKRKQEVARNHWNAVATQLPHGSQRHQLQGKAQQ